MMDFRGKVALITGAASGIGRATALRFAQLGARVMLADMDESGLQDAKNKITLLGAEAQFRKIDVSKEEEVRSLVAETVSTFGGLDHAFNNAGILGPNSPTAEYTAEIWDRVIAINLRGVWLCCKYEIPRMLANGKGTIVNTSSVAGLVGRRNFCAYAAAKHGVVGLTKAIALEYAQKGIRANAVCPGAVKTPMIEERIGNDPRVEKEFQNLAAIGRMGEASELASAVIWLSSDEASFVTGHMMVVDGGWTAI